MKTQQKIEIAKIKLNAIQQMQQEIWEDVERMEARMKQADITLSLRDAGRMIGKSARTVRRYLNDGRLASTNLLDVYEFHQKEKGSP